MTSIASNYLNQSCLIASWNLHTLIIHEMHLKMPSRETSICRRWFPSQRMSDLEFPCFSLLASTNWDQSLDLSVIPDAMVLIWRHWFNAKHIIGECVCLGMCVTPNLVALPDVLMERLTPVPLTIFRLNLKFDQNLPYFGLICTLPQRNFAYVTTVTCANFLCDRLSKF